MSNVSKTEWVSKQYSDDKNLSARINFHAENSTNKQGFSNWLWEQYKFADNFRILELGCGNGAQWQGRCDSLPNGASVI
jgi:hypothetical protein